MTNERDILDRLRAMLQPYQRDTTDDEPTIRDAISEIAAHRAEIEKLQENLEAMHDAAFAATVVADPPKPERWEVLSIPLPTINVWTEVDGEPFGASNSQIQCRRRRVSS